MGSAAAPVKQSQREETQGELIPRRGRKRLPDDEVCASTRKMRMLRSLACGNKYEKLARATGATAIAGVDEVGRGALFGPVVAAAVILPADTRIRGLRDSKQLLVLGRLASRMTMMRGIEPEFVYYLMSSTSLGAGDTPER